MALLGSLDAWDAEDEHRRDQSRTVGPCRDMTSPNSFAESEDRAGVDRPSGTQRAKFEAFSSLDASTLEIVLRHFDTPAIPETSP